MPHNWRGGGNYFYSEFDNFWGDDLHLQIIARISQKASVENSSAQRAIFYLFIQNLIFFFFDDLLLQIIVSISPKASVENSSAQ